MPNLVEIGQVVLVFWGRWKCGKFTTTTKDNRQFLIRKSHYSLWLRWAKNTYFPILCNLAIWLNSNFHIYCGSRSINLRHINRFTIPLVVAAANISKLLQAAGGRSNFDSNSHPNIVFSGLLWGVSNMDPSSCNTKNESNY